MSIKFNDIVFGKNDIRGIVGKDLTPELFKEVGKAYSQYVRQGQDRKMAVSVGCDARKHSPELTKALIEGLLESGVDVYDMGMCPTPLGYFSEYTIPDVEGSLIVTASHNPSEYNGVKMTFQKVGLTEGKITELKEIVKKGDFQSPLAKGSLKQFDIIGEYIKFQLKEFSGKGKGVKVVVDSANATGGVVAPQLYRDMGCEVIELFSEPDGDFPQSPPKP